MCQWDAIPAEEGFGNLGKGKMSEFIQWKAELRPLSVLKHFSTSRMPATLPAGCCVPCSSWSDVFGRGVTTERRNSLKKGQDWVEAEQL